MTTLLTLWLLGTPGLAHAGYYAPEVQDSLDICREQYVGLIDGIGTFAFQKLMYAKCFNKTLMHGRHYQGALDRPTPLAALIGTRATAEAVRAHLKAAWAAPGTSDERRRALAKELQTLNEKFESVTPVATADSASSS